MNRQYITIILLVLFLAGGYWFFGYSRQKTFSSNDVAQKAIDYLNNTLLPNGLSASLVEVVEKDDIVQVKFSVSDKEYTSYVTKSGGLFFVEGINLNDIQEKKTDKKISKNDKPEINLFVMSYCPYGLQSEKAFLPVSKLFGDKIDMSINFVSYAMHGKKEIDENLRQYCIQKEQKQNYNNYLACFVDDGDFDSCLASSQIDQSKMNSCISVVDKKYSVYSDFNNRDTWYNDSYPVFNIESDLNSEYGVKGSPTLVINGIVINGFERSPEGLKELVCNAFINEPEECSQTLSSDSLSPGFGLKEEIGVQKDKNQTNASCQ